MDVMVQWDETTAETVSIARVSSVASPDTFESPSRDVVTLYGVPTPESLALALAAAVESRKAEHGSRALRDLRVSAMHGAVGDAAWHADLLTEGGQAIRRLLAGLLMPDWPEGTRRALSVQLAVAGATRSSDMLAALREADADNFHDDD